MKLAAAILMDYLKNALQAAAIGGLLAVVVALAQGESVLRLGVAGVYALIGSACGTCSKAAIEGAFSLFGARRLLAYLLNAVVVAIVILVLGNVFFPGLGGLNPWAIVLIFALPEAVSVGLVRAGLGEAARFERALDRRRDSLDAKDGPE